MTKRCVQLFTLLILLLSALSVVGFARFNFVSQETVGYANLAGDPATKDLANYRQWIRVDERPLRNNNFQIDGAGD